MRPGDAVKCFATLLCVAAVAACGSSGTASATPSPSLTVPTPSQLATPPASRACPTAATVDAALGVSLPAPVGVAGIGGTTTLPPGAKLRVCEYHATSYNVIIVIITGITPAVIDKYSSEFPVPYSSVAGVGDQARAFSVPLGGGKDNEGVVATKGSTLVDVTATATPASLAQVEALVRQLL